MTTKKSRKSLNDPKALGFVYGDEQPKDESSVTETEPISEKPTEVTAPPTQPAKKQSLMSKLMDTPEKEAVVRLTVDLPESMHRKLSILCAKTGRKKAEIVRMLLDEALQEVEE